MNFVPGRFFHRVHPGTGISKQVMRIDRLVTSRIPPGTLFVPTLEPKSGAKGVVRPVPATTHIKAKVTETASVRAV